MRTLLDLCAFRPRAKTLVAALASASCLLSAGAALAFDADGDSVSDQADAFPCKAGSAAVTFAPAQGVHGMLLVEDQWPSLGDNDFNDAVLAYNYIFELDAQGRVRSLRATFNLLALGGVFNNGLGLRLLGVPVSAVSSVRQSIGSDPSQALSAQGADPSNLTLRLLPNMRALFDNQAGPINSDPTLSTVAGKTLEVEIAFSTPQSIDLGQAPFDLYIFRTEEVAHEIHRPQYAGTAEMNTALFNSQDDGSSSQRHFVDTRGLPFMLLLPELRPWTQEGRPLSGLYPRILQFASSGGTQAQDYYERGIDLDFAFGAPTPLPQPKSDGSISWASPVEPGFIGPSDIPADTGCVDAWGLSVSYGTARDTFGYDSVMDASGNLIVTGYTSRSFTSNTNQGAEDVFVAKYNRSTGALLWSRQFGGTLSDVGRAVTVDASGNIYVTGETRSSFGSQSNAGQYDAFLTKLDSSGNVLWTRFLGGSDFDYGTGVAVDASGAIFIGGGSGSSNLAGASFPGNAPNSFLAKYDTSGNRTWVQQFRTDPSHASNYNYTADIALDPSGNVLVVGSERRFSQSASSAESQFVAKYSGSSGSQIWVQHIGEAGQYLGSANYRYGHAVSVAVDAAGAAYVAGSWEGRNVTGGWAGWSRASADGSADATLVKVDASGNLLWSRSLASSNAALDASQSVRTDSAGNIYLVGYTAGTMPGQSSRGGYDYFVARFDSSGTQSWLTQQGTNVDDGAFGLGVDSTGAMAYVLGNTGNVSGTPVAFQFTFYGFIAQHPLATGAQSSYAATVDSSAVGTSCQTIKSASPSATSGLYTLDPDGPGGAAPFDAYCDMTTDGGGWTVIFTPTSTNYQTPSLGYTINSSALLSSVSQVLTAFRTSSNAVTGDWARFAMPSRWRTQSPFQYSGVDESVSVVISGQAAVTSTLRYGYLNWSTLCTDNWYPDSVCGRICLTNTRAPYYTGFDYQSVDYCQTSQENWSVTPCTSERRYTIAVR